MLNKVDPLRREMSNLENAAEVTRVKGEEINKIIQGLETSISKYKEEYAVLISQVNTIKADLVTVEAKVNTHPPHLPKLFARMLTGTLWDLMCCCLGAF